MPGTLSYAQDKVQDGEGKSGLRGDREWGECISHLVYIIC